MIDISQPVGTRTAVWPGDRAIEVGWTMRRARGDSVNVAALEMSVHAGTHIDGPYHFDDNASRPAELPLDAYIGPAIVVDARDCDPLDDRLLDRIRTIATGSRAESAANDDAFLAGARILFRTRGTIDETEFPATFAALDPGFAERLARAGVRLVGTDAPSVDPVDSKTLDAHRTLAAGSVAILENAVLQDVPPGRYTLVALPLKLVDTDSSPVRAVLLPPPPEHAP